MTSSSEGAVWNWDISLFKNIPLGGSRRLQLRVELYNAFDTDQFTGRNTNAQFDYTTKALGEHDGVRDDDQHHQPGSPDSAGGAFHVLTRPSGERVCPAPPGLPPGAACGSDALGLRGA